MKTLNFFLLDIGGETTADGSEIRLWGADEKGRSTLIIDRQYKPRFYAIPKEDSSTESLAEDLSSSKMMHSQILSVSIVEKKLFSRKVGAVEIVCKSTEALEETVKKLVSDNSVSQVLGDDIRYATQYMINRDVRPSQWNEMDVEKYDLPEGQMDNVYLAVGTPRQSVREDRPSFRVLAFSRIAFAEKSSPHATNDPISIISVATSDGHVQTFVRSNSSDRDLISEFTSCFLKFDPHIVAGFDSNRTDWPYLIERAKRSGAKLNVGTLGSQPHTSVYGHISITGRANLDIFDYATEVPEVKVKTIENVAAFLGIKLEPVLPDEFELSEIWKITDGKDRLVKCAEEQAQAILEMTQRFLDFALELSSLISMPLDQVGTAAVGHRVDSYLIKEACKQGHLIPHRSEQPYARYQGAIVLAPRQGLHDDVVALDFASMYPNLMILYNLSPDTFVSPHEKVADEDCWVIDEHRFRKTPPGLYKAALSNLISFRNEIKKRLKAEPLSESQTRLLRERERAVKVITNACYGYAGWIGARWYAREVAESAAALGRKTIMQVIERCREMNLPIIYADTDSVFVTFDKRKVGSLLRWASENLHLDIRPDKTYRRVLFTEAKKRYAGLLEDGNLDIVGLEVVRGDWSEIARRIQERVIEIVLREASPIKAKNYALAAIDQVRRVKVSMEDLVIWKSLTKPIEEYKVKAPHVEVARRYLSAGRELLPGDKIGYVVTKGDGKLYEKAQPYFAVAPEQVDAEYYVTNQIVPAVARILKLFKIGEDELLPGG